MTMTLEGRNAVVTGGARGIGEAIVRELVDAGAGVLVADVRDEPGKALAEQLGEAAVYAHLDVTDPDGWAAATQVAERELGPVSVLVNNAGIVEWGTIEEQSPESFRRVVDVNLFGPWLGMRAVAPSMRRAGGGCVVNVSSTAGLIGYADLGAYTASKWGCVG